MSSPQRNTPRLFIAGCMMAAGGLITAFCGLCTAGFLLSWSWDHAHGVPGPPPDIAYDILYLVIGVPPMLVGLALFIPGLYIWRAARRKPMPLLDPKDSFVP